MSEELTQVMEELKKLTKLITKDDFNMVPLAEVPDNQDCGNVCYTRLYKTDEDIMDEVCKKSGRKKSAVIRILVSEGLRRNLINA